MLIFPITTLLITFLSTGNSRVHITMTKIQNGGESLNWTSFFYLLLGMTEHSILVQLICHNNYLILFQLCVSIWYDVLQRSQGSILQDTQHNVCHLSVFPPLHLLCQQLNFTLHFCFPIMALINLKCKYVNEGTFWTLNTSLSQQYRAQTTKYYLHNKKFRVT